MTNKNSSTRQPLLGMLLGGFDRLSSAGGKAVLDEQLVKPNGPLGATQATFLEATFGGLLLLLRLYVPMLFRRGAAHGQTGARPGRSGTSRMSRTFAFLTFLTIAGDKALFVIALTSIPFGIAGGIYYAIPLAIPVITGFRSGSRWRAAVLTLFAAAIAAGVFLLVQDDGSTQTSHFLLGVLCAVGAGVSRTLFLPVTDRLIREQGRRFTEEAIAWSMLMIGLIAGGITWLTDGFDPLHGWQIIAWAVVVGLLNNALPRIIQMPAREYAGDAVYAVFLAASPVIATLVGVTVLGDRLSLVQWGGLIVITVASAAVANMSFALKERHHVPLIELATATPQMRHQAAVKELGDAERRLDELASQVQTLQGKVAATAVEVADLEAAGAQAKATAAQEKANNAKANLEKAEETAKIAWEQANQALERQRRAREKMPTST